MERPVLLTVSATDTSSGAGLQQDVRIADILHCPSVNVITAQTIQNQNGLLSILPTPFSFFKESLDCMLQSYQIGVVKIGALVNHEQLLLLRSKLLDTNIPVVMDPVFAPTNGTSFYVVNNPSKWLTSIAGWVTVLTPNKQELEILLHNQFDTLEDAIALAQKLIPFIVPFVALKGGHFKNTQVTDYFLSAGTTLHFSKKRQIWKYQHGTGCTFSTAMACFYLQTNDWMRAFELASHWTSEYYSANLLNAD